MKEVSQNVVNALRLLECFVESEELGITELAMEIGVSKTVAARLVSSLESFGYLRQNPNTKKYRLGLKLVYLSSLVKDRKELIQLINPYLRKLSQEYQVSAHLAVYDKRGAMIVDKVTAGPLIYMDSRVGAVLPIHACATGKCLLAYGDEKETHRIVHNLTLERFTDQTITDPRILEDELCLIRKRGYALDAEESNPGLYCIAVPIFNSGKTIVAAISLSGQARFMIENTPQILASLKKVQRELITYL